MVYKVGFYWLITQIDMNQVARGMLHFNACDIAIITAAKQLELNSLLCNAHCSVTKTVLL